MFLFIKKEISNKVVLVLALRCGCGHTDIKKRESFARYVVGVSTPVPSDSCVVNVRSPTPFQEAESFSYTPYVVGYPHPYFFMGVWTPTWYSV